LLERGGVDKLKIFGIDLPPFHTWWVLVIAEKLGKTTM